MDKKNLLVIVGSLVAGIVAVLAMNFYIGTKEKELYKGMDMVPVIVASKDLAAGTRLTTEMISRRQIPSKYKHGNTVPPEEFKLILGQALNFPLKVGDPVLWSDIKGEAEIKGKQGLAGRITKGERAVSIDINSSAGVSGLLKPNNHIDLLCTVKNQESGEETTITLMQNLTILAVGSSLIPENLNPNSGNGYSSITLLVTIEEAELLVFAEQKGKLVAVLRNPEDIETLKDIPKIDFSNILQDDFRNKVQTNRDNIEIIKRGKVEK